MRRTAPVVFNFNYAHPIGSAVIAEDYIIIKVSFEDLVKCLARPQDVESIYAFSISIASTT